VVAGQSAPVRAVDGPEQSTYALTTVLKAVRVLRAFTYDEPVLGVSELARRLGYGKSTVHRILITLAEEGLVARTPSGQYRLGLGLLELGQVAVASLELREVAHGPLERLRNDTGETAHLAVFEPPDVVYLERFESPSTLRMFSRLGRRNHAHVTSSGKCLLAFGTSGDLDEVIAAGLPRIGPRSITQPRLLETALEEVRDRGYAVSVEESERGVASVGAPVFDHHGNCVAAVSVAGPVLRMPADGLDRFATLVVRTGREISTALGYGIARKDVG
jgi:IclR family KDG regulon transcriptional repressor